jgi:hypothetical protein
MTADFAAACHNPHSVRTSKAAKIPLGEYDPLANGLWLQYVLRRERLDERGECRRRGCVPRTPARDLLPAGIYAAESREAPDR